MPNGSVALGVSASSASAASIVGASTDSSPTTATRIGRMPASLPTPPPTVPARGPATRVFGVLTSPRATYADVAARPGWLGALLVVWVATIVPPTWLLSTEIGQRAVIDQQMQTIEGFGGTVSDAQYQRLERLAPLAPTFAAASLIVGLPLAALFIAGNVFAIFNGGFGANAAFRQVFSVVAFSGMVMGIRAIVSTPLNYARESLSSPTTLAAVLPFFEDSTFGGLLFASLDLFLIWWVINLAIGLGVLYHRPTTPIATTMLVAYGAIALTIAAVRSMLTGAS